MLYSPSSHGFYSPEIYYPALPDDVVEISLEEHAALLASQAAGMVIAAGSDGLPITHVRPAPTAEQLAVQARVKRAALMSKTDYLFTRDYPASAVKLAAVKTYRQALRDVPAQPGFPLEIDWPAKP